MAGRTRRPAAVSPRNGPDYAGKVGAALEALRLPPEDGAAAALALGYGRVLDQATADEVPLPDQVKAVAELGPKLLAVLDALGATPKARTAKNTPALAGTSRLAALREGLAS